MCWDRRVAVVRGLVWVKVNSILTVYRYTSSDDLLQDITGNGRLATGSSLSIVLTPTSVRFMTYVRTLLAVS